MLAGCATVGAGEARRLRDEGDALLAAGDHEAAYRTLAQIRARHPGSAEAREVFPAAALVFKRHWWSNRYTDPGSSWLTTEPAFLFEWLDSLATADFPQQEAERLLIGMPYPFFLEFQAFAASRAGLGRWRLAAERDNGIVESIAAEPVAAEPVR